MRFDISSGVFDIRIEYNTTERKTKFSLFRRQVLHLHSIRKREVTLIMMHSSVLFFSSASHYIPILLLLSPVLKMIVTGLKCLEHRIQ